MDTEHSIDNNNTGIVILAGGMGSRLGKGPKINLDLPGTNHTLLSYIISKYPRYKIAVMISCKFADINTNYIKDYEFVNKEDPYIIGARILFFKQNEEPLYLPSGEIYKNSSNNVILAPNGNGHTFKLLREHNILGYWKKKGIKYLNVIPIDNPYLKPLSFDEFDNIDFKDEFDVLLRTISRKKGDKIGAIMTNDFNGDYRSIKIIEYINLSEEQDNKLNKGYSGTFYCSISWASIVSYINLPYHKIIKVHDDVNVIKLETFIFDLFQYSNNIQMIDLDAEQFKPIKNINDFSNLNKLI